MGEARIGTRRTTSRWARARVVAARAALVLVGLLCLAQALSLWRGAPVASLMGAVDLAFMPKLAAIALDLVVGMFALWWAVRPRAAAWRRAATAVVLLLLAACACVGVAGFYASWRAGAIAPALPVPMEAVAALVLAAAAHVVWRDRAAAAASPMLFVLAVALAVVLYPLALGVFSGSVDHRVRADVAVVFGAKVNADGTLSPSLDDRVRTAAVLYRSGLVRSLVMSGATGAEGYDEPGTMRRRAERLGVPSRAIVLDRLGVDTAATVADTVPLLRREHAGRVLAVSQFYHLPRVRFAFAEAGLDVLTVPASPSRYIVATPVFMLRDAAGYWVYWTLAVLGRTR